MPFRVIILLAVLLLAACTSAPPEPPPDPVALLAQATDNVLAVNSLKMLVERTGADYILRTDLGDALFNRMEAQYVAPDIMQARARIAIRRIPAEVEIFARDADQWWRLTGTPWQNMIFLPGFNPRELLQLEDRGLRAAFRALDDVTFVEETTIEDGTPVWHLRATAEGEEVSWLMLYLVIIEGATTVDVYIARETRLPAKLVVTHTDNADDPAGPTTWTLEFYDYNSEVQLDLPEGVALPTEAAS